MKKFNEIIEENFGELSEQEQDKLLSYFHEEKLNKHDFFTQTGKYCNRLSLIKSGILRIYTLSDGKEITQWISRIIL